MRSDREPPPATGPDHEALAKAWLVRMVERTPLGEAADLDLGRLAGSAPALIAGILDSLASSRSAARGAVSRLRPAWLTGLRGGPRGPALVAGDLAALHEVLIEAVRAAPEPASADFAIAVGRLAAVFGALQEAVVDELLAKTSEAGGAARHHEGLPGKERFDERLRDLLAEEGRYGHPFGLALVEIDGLGPLADALGPDAAEPVIGAVSGLIARHVRDADHAFRIGEDQLAVLAPHQEAPSLEPMAERIATVIYESRLTSGPPVTVTIGVAASPAHGDTAEALLDAAQEACYAARAAGRPIAIHP